MVECPSCGMEMKIGGHIGSEPVYNCDNCGIDNYQPPKSKIPPKRDIETKIGDEEKTTHKQKKRRY